MFAKQAVCDTLDTAVPAGTEKKVVLPSVTESKNPLDFARALIRIILELSYWYIVQLYCRHITSYMIYDVHHR